MRKLIALLMVLGLVGFAVAQDLDAPTSGTAVNEEEGSGNSGNSAIFDLIVSKLKDAENFGRMRRSNYRFKYVWNWNMFLQGGSRWVTAERAAGHLPSEEVEAYSLISATEQAALATILNDTYKNVQAAAFN